MGRVAKVLEFVRAVRGGANVSDAKVDTGGGAIQTADHFSAPGDDSFPLSTDYAFVQDSAGTGRGAAVGYADPLNTPKALAGEKRTYARNANGVAVGEIWQKADGTIVLENANGIFILAPDGFIGATNSNGNFELRADGTFESNGVTISPSGDMDVPTSLKVGGKELAGHTHNINSGSSAPGPTGGNN